MTLAIKSFDRCTPNLNYEDQNAVPSPGLGTLSGVLCGEELGQLHTPVLFHFHDRPARQFPFFLVCR